LAQPSTPGWYWYKLATSKQLGVSQVVEVVDLDGVLSVLPSNEGDAFKSPKPVASFGRLWAGPIEVPA